MELESKSKGYFRPYFYRLEYCKDSDQRYRRIFKADVGENGSLSFLPAFVHEEDAGSGVSCSSQPSFHVLQEEIGTYDEDFVENPYIQAIPVDAWKSLFGQPLSNVQLPVLTLPFESEPETLLKIVDEFASIGENQTFAYAVDRVVDLCVLGMDTYGPGST